ncbi:hypothetical protein [Nitratireductor sp. StC3]|uniref:hypothetical protein n=1 Tax=Nitratireductor sp. StC3 TaxID=2126741 RepID=UPI0011B25DB3|nr:hypothetical protein [Nitratireductor sp. StC3]
MSKIIIDCPVTGKPVSTGWVMDRSSFKTAQLDGGGFGPCPECGRMHGWSRKDARLETDGGEG